MMTSSNGNIFRVTGPLCGEFTGHGEFPTQRPVTRIFDVFFDLRLNKRLNKQSWGWWFETLSRPFWRHRNDHKTFECVGCYMCAHQLHGYQITVNPVIWCQSEYRYLIYKGYSKVFSMFLPLALRMVRSLWMYVLTYWGRDKMTDISQTTFSKTFSWMKIYEFR